VEDGHVPFQPQKVAIRYPVCLGPWLSTGIRPSGVAHDQVSKWMIGATMIGPCAMAADSTWTRTLMRRCG